MTVKTLSALQPPAMTQAQRDAIPAGRRPQGAAIFNTDTDRLELNLGSDATPFWFGDPPELTTVPTSPIHGQEFYYVISGAGSNFPIWHMRWSATRWGGAWEFLGGTPMVNSVTPDQTFAEGAAMVGAGTAIVLQLPRAGDYLVEHLCNQYVASQAAAGQMEAQVLASSGTWDGTGLTGGGALAIGYCAGGTAFTNHATDIIRGLAANGTLTQQYRCGTALGGTAHTRWRSLRVWPLKFT